jgi:hypothetical protein
MANFTEETVTNPNAATVSDLKILKRKYFSGTLLNTDKYNA